MFNISRSKQSLTWNTFSTIATNNLGDNYVSNGTPCIYNICECPFFEYIYALAFFAHEYTFFKCIECIQSDALSKIILNVFVIFEFNKKTFFFSTEIAIIDCNW